MLNPKKIAWNGVRCNIPAAWEISRMGPYYLQLEDDDGPVLELKWHPIKGRFSHDAHLKKVAARRWHRQQVKVEGCDMPDGWTAALAEYTARCFQWQGPHIKGRGVILYCVHCRTAHLLQFLRSDILDDHELCIRILASFSDHPEPGQKRNTRWAVYDLCADIPDTFKLRHYRFDPGAFQLAFDGPRRSTLSLFRWGPASLVLAQQTLEGFVVDNLPWINKGLTAGLIREENFIHLEGAYPTQAWAQWFRRLMRKPVFHWMHAWHDESKNRILAVDAHGIAPLPREVLQQVSDQYVMV